MSLKAAIFSFPSAASYCTGNMLFLKLTLPFLYMCLVLQSVRNEELDDDDDDDLDNDDGDVEEIAVRRRRTSCENPQTKRQSKYFFRLLYGSSHFKGKTSYIHDQILLYNTYTVVGWTMKGKSGDANSQQPYRKPGFLKEYEIYYLPVNGRWVQLKDASGNTVFTNKADVSSPDKKTEVTLSEPIVTSVLRLYPKDWEGVPFYTIDVKYCAASRGSLTAKKLWRPTLPPTTTTTTTTTTPTPTESVKERIAKTMEHVKKVALKEKQEKKLLRKALKKLAQQKKAIEKEIRKAKEAKTKTNSYPKIAKKPSPKQEKKVSPKYDMDLDDMEFEEFF